MKTIKKSLLLALVASTSVALAEGSLEDRVANLEADKALNTFHFSGALWTRYDDITASQTGSSVLNDHTDYMRLRAALNSDADVSNNIKVYTRFATSKFYNRWATQTPNTLAPNGASTAGTPTLPSGFVTDLGASRNEQNGPTLMLEKAYADYSPDGSKFVFSFGRLPTFDGPLTHMSKDKARQGTYASLTYNAVLDGLALSYNDKLGGGDFSARVIYSPFTYNESNAGFIAPAVPSNIHAPTPTNNATGAPMRTIDDMVTLMLEWDKDLGTAGKIAVMYQGYDLTDAAYTGADFHVTDNTGGNFGMVSGTGEIDVGVIAHTLTVEWDHFLGSNFDLGYSFLNSTVSNSGQMSLGTSTYYGIGATAANQSISSSESLVVLKYRVNNKMTIGTELLFGSSGIFSYDSCSEMLTGFYGTPGTSSNSFMTYKVTPEMTAVLGAVFQNYSALPMAFGPVTSSNRTIQTYFTSLNVDF